MAPRLSPRASLATAALLLAGCVVQTTETSQSKGAAGSGQAGSGQAGSGQAGAGLAGAGQAGSAQAGSGQGGSGAAGSGQAGQGGGQAGGSGQAGGAADDPCKGVPAEGRCIDGASFERCLSGGLGADGAQATPQVITKTCDPGTTCQQGDGWAGCMPTSECIEGSSYCESSTVRAACQGGKYQKETCSEQCKPSLGGAACVVDSGQAGQLFTIQGKLLYEYRPVRDDKKGYGDPIPDAAKGLIAMAYDGDEYLGGTYTSGEDGSFAIEVAKKPSAQATLWFMPMLYDEGGAPQFAVAIPDGTDIYNLKSKGYYAFGRNTGDKLDVGELLITEAEGSPAIHIHQWVLYSILQMRQVLPSAKPFNVLALWAPEKQFPACGHGTCYAPRGYGATVDYGSGSDFYQGALLLAGTEDTPHQHSRSVILHEFGHYAMEAYSRSPNEAAQHSLAMLEPPGMAWSEGWATYLGQSMQQDTTYFDKQQGVTWWYDVSKPYYAAPKLDPQGPIDQQLGEANVSYMLWHLDDSGSDPWDKSSLGQAALLKAVNAPRVASGKHNRGYKTVDLVDMLDSLRCGGATSEAVLSVTKNENFPYDDAPLCP